MLSRAIRFSSPLCSRCLPWLPWNCSVQLLLTVCLPLGWHTVGELGPIKGCSGIGRGLYRASSGPGTSASHRGRKWVFAGRPGLWSPCVFSLRAAAAGLHSLFRSCQEPMLCVLGSQGLGTWCGEQMGCVRAQCWLMGNKVPAVRALLRLLSLFHS